MFCFSRIPEFKEGRFTFEFETSKFYFYRVFFDKQPTEYALKVFKNTDDAKRSYLREKTFLSKLKNPHILKIGPENYLKKVFHHPYLLVEYAQSKDLFYLVRDLKSLDEEVARTYFHQVIKGIEYIHKKKIAHMDIKLENLFLDKDYSIKVGDFDLAQYFEEKCQKGKGTRNYRAPEVIRRKCQNFGAADIYSIGVVLFLMLLGRFPFAERKVNNTIELDLYATFQEDPDAFWNYHLTHSNKTVSQDFKDLIEAMLELDPNKRPTIDEIKCSEWYQGKTLSKKELKAAILKALNEPKSIQ